MGRGEGSGVEDGAGDMFFNTHVLLGYTGTPETWPMFIRGINLVPGTRCPVSC